MGWSGVLGAAAGEKSDQAGSRVSPQGVEEAHPCPGRDKTHSEAGPGAPWEAQAESGSRSGSAGVCDPTGQRTSQGVRKPEVSKWLTEPHLRWQCPEKSGLLGVTLKRADGGRLTSPSPCAGDVLLPPFS